MSLWKYECSVCQRLVSLKKDGTIRAHGYRNEPYMTSFCMGSGLPPKGEHGVGVDVSVTGPEGEPLAGWHTTDEGEHIVDEKVTGPFKSVEPTEEQQKLIDQARRAYEVMRLDIKANTPVGRYQSLALTALEESAMWLNKALTHG